jgi:hypothetical protein
MALAARPSLAAALLAVAVAGAAAGVAACGGDDPSQGGDAGAGGGSGPLLPWAAGNRWTYQVTGDGGVSTKVTTVGELEPVGGSGPNAAVMANRVTTTKGAGDRTLSWQAVVGDAVVRYREQSFHAKTGALELEEHWSPHKLHVDAAAAHTAAGASWLEQYEETKIDAGAAPVTGTARDRWTVTAVDQEVTVPAGTFRALVMQKAGASTAKTYWYVRGVGKVKETGGQTEELVRWEPAP